MAKFSSKEKIQAIKRYLGGEVDIDIYLSVALSVD